MLTGASRSQRTKENTYALAMDEEDVGKSGEIFYVILDPEAVILLQLQLSLVQRQSQCLKKVYILYEFIINRITRFDNGKVNSLPFKL